MKKIADLPLSVENAIIGEQPVLNIHVSRKNLKDWCLALQMLQDNLVETMIFKTINSPIQKLEFAVGKENKCNTKGSDALHVTIANASLDYVRHFFLRYYRDGAAEVNHIDLETNVKGYITFFAEEYLPPVSLREAKRNLGLE